MNATAKVIGLDIAKNLFVAVGIDETGKKLSTVKLSREAVLPKFANLPAALIGIEACADLYYWVRKLTSFGHTVHLIATEVLATVADAHHFKTGHDFSANLGLVPREHSSGGKQRLYGITKRGYGYLRTLLVHGARSALCCAGRQNWPSAAASRSRQ